MSNVKVCREMEKRGTQSATVQTYLSLLEFTALRLTLRRLHALLCTALSGRIRNDASLLNRVGAD